jgi:ribonuclease HI
MQQFKRFTTIRNSFTALSQWAVKVLSTLPVRPVLPTAPCPWDGTGSVVAVIRGGGSAFMATAALAYTGPDGEDHVEMFRGYSYNGNARHAAAAARIEALAFILNHPSATMIHLFIDDPEMRRAVTAAQDAFPLLQLVVSADAHLSNKAAQAASRANSVTINASAAASRLALHQSVGECRTVIATDASIVPGKAGAGMAAVASDGTIWQGRLPGTSDITWAEMNAIHGAITHHPGNDLLVLSDSQGAVAFANGTAIPVQARMRRLAAQLQAQRDGRDIDIQWVRAHNGHPLNEAADAMARHARHGTTAATQAA